MAWKDLNFKLTSSAPLIMHNGQAADPLNKWAKAIKLISSKKAKTDADHEEIARLEFMSGLYLDESGPIIPSYVIEGVVLGGAKKSKEGLLSKSGCFCLKHAYLEYDGPRTADELWDDDRFRFSALVRVKMARIPRMRPIFREWSAVVTLSVEDSVINPGRVMDWLTVSGTQVGLCDWRPQFGRFTVEKVS